MNEGGDLRYHIGRRRFFTEEQTSIQKLIFYCYFKIKINS